MSMACSAKTLTRGVHEVFDFAHRMMEYPVPPLYDKLSQVPCTSHAVFRVQCEMQLSVHACNALAGPYARVLYRCATHF